MDEDGANLEDEFEVQEEAKEEAKEEQNEVVRREVQSKPTLSRKPEVQTLNPPHDRG